MINDPRPVRLSFEQILHNRAAAREADRMKRDLDLRELEFKYKHRLKIENVEWIKRKVAELSWSDKLDYLKEWLSFDFDWKYSNTSDLKHLEYKTFNQFLSETVSNINIDAFRWTRPQLYGPRIYEVIDGKYIVLVGTQI